MTRKNDDGGGDGDGGGVVSLELLGDPCDNLQGFPFDPERHGLPADFQLTKFADSRRKSLLLDRQERQLLLDLLDVKKVIARTRTRNWRESESFVGPSASDDNSRCIVRIVF